VAIVSKPEPRIRPSYQRAHTGRVFVFDAAALPWQATEHAGLKLKAVRNDDAKGEFLGLVSFAPFVRSAVHQHTGVATSFVLDGGLTDYHGSLTLHQVGINVRGSTHDAVSYQSTLLVSRLEAPVLYAPDDGVPTGMHAGSRVQPFANPNPDVPPEVNVTVDALPLQPTGLAGVTRQMVFDYAGTGTTRRLVQLQWRPTTTLPPASASDWIELWVRGGELHVNGQRAPANCFVVIEPGAAFALQAPFGASALAWAEGRESWPDGTAGNLFGF
jgi:hypothetical protein